MASLRKAILAVVFVASPGIVAAQPVEFQECETCPVMVEIPPGSLERSDTVNGANFTVNIAAPYAIAKTEVTIKQFELFVEETGTSITGCTIWTTVGPENPRRVSWKSPFTETGVFPDHPVVCVSWDDAQAYTAWLSEKTGQAYRLPSEAEWAYAARAGAPNDPTWWLTGYMGPGEANCADCTGVGPMGREDELSTLSVAQYVPNQFGLHDMLGNAGEWVEDCYNKSIEGAPADGTTWQTGDCSRHINMGGSWHEEWQSLAVQRAGLEATQRVNDIGFRVARSLD